MTTTEAEEEAAPSLAPAPGSTVPPWREGLPVTVLAPDYQRILGVLEQQRSTGHGPLRAKEIAVELSLGATPDKVEGLRSNGHTPRLKVVPTGKGVAHCLLQEGKDRVLNQKKGAAGQPVTCSAQR
ncbi:hypothetical protein O1L68_00085 [Streptomyces lydicus]|nr:hypothetical protein [Streptomyces lydicus]